MVAKFKFEDLFSPRHFRICLKCFKRHQIEKKALRRVAGMLNKQFLKTAEGQQTTGINNKK